MAYSDSIVVTTGEPAGIGPDIALALADIPLPAPLVLMGDRELLAERAHLLGKAVQFTEADTERKHQGDGSIAVLHIPTVASVQTGIEDARNAAYVLEQLETAARGCLDGVYGALVTAPVNKAVINQSGRAFTGHTEFFGDLTQCKPVMMLAVKNFRIALVTTHLPLREVADAITKENLLQTLLIVNEGLKKYCGKSKPRIGVCGLNPHAGEQGYLGTEEQTVIQPVIQELKRQGLDVVGPLSADTAFLPTGLEDMDIVVVMFHDQGLPVIKHAGFGDVVNVTLGLPFLRASVDHGTAPDLAGSGKASSASLIAAVKWSISAAD